MKQRILSEAEREYTHSVLYYHKASVSVAKGFIHEVEKSLKQIMEAPMRYPLWRRDIRFKNLLVYPFTIYYRVNNEEVLIAAIAHQKRRPGYWLERRS